MGEFKEAQIAVIATTCRLQVYLMLVGPLITTSTSFHPTNFVASTFGVCYISRRGLNQADFLTSREQQWNPLRPSIQNKNDGETLPRRTPPLKSAYLRSLAHEILRRFTMTTLSAFVGSLSEPQKKEDILPGRN